MNPETHTWHLFAAPRHSEQISRHADSAMITREAVQSLEVSSQSSCCSRPTLQLDQPTEDHAVMLELPADMWLCWTSRAYAYV